VIPLALIIICVKLSYYFDREKSMNFEIETQQKALKDFAQSLGLATT
jgi:hypothetical protein